MRLGCDAAGRLLVSRRSARGARLLGCRFRLCARRSLAASSRWLHVRLLGARGILCRCRCMWCSIWFPSRVAIARRTPAGCCISLILVAAGRRPPWVVIFRRAHICLEQEVVAGAELISNRGLWRRDGVLQRGWCVSARACGLRCRCYVSECCEDWSV